MLVVNDLVLVIDIFTMPSEHPLHARVQYEDKCLGTEDTLPEWNKT